MTKVKIGTFSTLFLNIIEYDKQLVALLARNRQFILHHGMLFALNTLYIYIFLNQVFHAIMQINLGSRPF